jgi:two-component system, sensor histidine kinase PdtaS
VNKAEELLRENEAHFSSVANALPVMAWRTGPDAKVTFFNQAWLDFTGRRLEEEVGDGWTAGLHPHDARWCIDTFLEAFNERREFRMEHRLRRQDAQFRWILNSGAPHYTTEGAFTGYIGVGVDITEHRVEETSLRSALHAKELFVKEIHHRVKNNMQVICSFLSVHARHLHDERDRMVFQESQARVQSMSLIHEKLSQSRDLMRVDFPEYLKNLASDLIRTYEIDTNTVRLTVQAGEPLHLNIETVVPLGMIVNELISNALKYAFPGGRPGRVTIDLRRVVDGTFTLSVSDDGTGLPAGTDPMNARSLGFQIIRTLAEQLKCRLEFSHQGGTVCRLTFTPKTL